jgi:malate synthase
MTHVSHGGLAVAAPLDAFLVEQVLPQAGIAPGRWFAGAEALLRALMPVNQALLERREALQAQLDAYWADHAGQRTPADQEAFLRAIGYLAEPPPPFTIGTTGVDAEVAAMAGPQLVVPLDNARYVLNAVAARWGSLYDALYGTDALGDLPPPGPYDPARGARVVAWARGFLDEAAALDGASHGEVSAYAVDAEGLLARTPGGLRRLKPGAKTEAFAGSAQSPSAILLRHHGLGIELVIDRAHPVGAAHPAGLADVRLEAALTAIMDCEDSVAAVDAQDKTRVYANWLGLMRGDLSAGFEKGGRLMTRAMPADTAMTAPDGSPVTVRRRALMFIRNVGHLMRSNAMLLDGEPVFEGLMDALVTATAALVDLRRPPGARNSPAGSVYIVKPKMHGPDEAAFTDRLFAGVEDLLGLARNTLKVGVMDEERRTSLNLAATIHAVRERVVFINTGFLDRTGDEMHSAMRSGAFVRKEAMKREPWFLAYEDNNVDVGLACGLPGRAQIGKGMWAMPDRMAAMLEAKVAHPLAGATTAWVPSPTAATLHAIHYHRVDVAARQREIAAAGPRARLADLLTVPLAQATNWPPEEVAAELENNCQGILGYVARWVEQGVGCSKVPDIHDVGLMEDRATLRISSQHVANWLAHGVVTAAQVEAALRKMAAVVDRQNEGDPAYRPMAPDFEASAAFRAARALIFEGAAQPSGYTEPLLHAARRAFKAQAGG